MLANMGVFIDLLLKSDNIDAVTALREICGIVPDWDRFKDSQFNSKGVIELAHSLRSEIGNHAGLCGGQVLRESLLRDGHRFLIEVHSLAYQHGLRIGVGEIDKPLVLSEVIVTA